MWARGVLYDARMKQFSFHALRVALVGGCLLTTTSCALLGSVIGLLSSPLRLAQGLVGDATETEQGPYGPVQRGAEIESRGPLLPPVYERPVASPTERLESR